MFHVKYIHSMRSVHIPRVENAAGKKKQKCLQNWHLEEVVFEPILRALFHCVAIPAKMLPTHHSVLSSCDNLDKVFKV